MKQIRWFMVAAIAITFVCFVMKGKSDTPIYAKQSVVVEETQQSENFDEVKYIHWNAKDGDDRYDGSSSENGVKTFAKARSLMNDGDILLVDETVSIDHDEIWDLSALPNSKIQRNTVGYMVQILGNYTLTLNHIVMDGEHYSNPKEGTDSMIGLGKIGGNVNHGAKLILNTGTILENNTNAYLSGGAISTYSYDTIIMNDGAVIRNNGTVDRCADFGGAISLENHGTFIMNGGVIDNNHAVRGGAVSLIASSMLMNGGEITNNSANSKNTYSGHYGGGIYLSNFQDWSTVGNDYSREIAGEASFVMHGGVIQNNQATYQNGTDIGLGGAIATVPRYDQGFEMEPKITVDLNGGKLIDNHAINGGAISAYFAAVELHVSNMQITNNQALRQGGAIYGVFNADIEIDNSLLSNNQAQLGGAIYLNASSMLMTSGEIQNNQAHKQGGGIYIASGAWNDEVAICSLLGGTIQDNVAKENLGSDGIYQGSELHIGDSLWIHKNNDIYLPINRIINVIKPLERVDHKHAVSITSEEYTVENAKQPGTRLVKYEELAGGEKAAFEAQQKQFYLPSKYMPKQLVIGKSEAPSQLDYMTYIDKEKYHVTYRFISANEDYALSDEILTLLPMDHERYLEDVMVKAIMPNKTMVRTQDGIWTFQGYDADEKLVLGDVEFVGTWTFQLFASPINRIPNIIAEDKVLYVGDTFDAMFDVRASDLEDGDLTKKLEIVKNEVDTSKVGVYEVSYKVFDSKQASCIKTITVTVKEKEGIAPIEPDTQTPPTTEDEGQLHENPIKPQMPNEDQKDPTPQLDEEVKDESIYEVQGEDKETVYTGDHDYLFAYAFLTIISVMILILLAILKNKCFE